MGFDPKETLVRKVEWTRFLEILIENFKEKQKFGN